MALAGLSGGGDPADLAGLPGFASYQPIPTCLEEVDAEVPEPEYRPRSLPLPQGSYTIRTPEDPAPGLHIIVYAVPVSLDDFATFVLNKWPASGWELGRGEREPGEAESVFYTPDKSTYGQFRARMVYCDENFTELTLTISESTPESTARNSP